MSWPTGPSHLLPPAGYRGKEAGTLPQTHSVPPLQQSRAWSLRDHRASFCLSLQQVKLLEWTDLATLITRSLAQIDTCLI